MTDKDTDTVLASQGHRKDTPDTGELVRWNRSKAAMKTTISRLREALEYTAMTGVAGPPGKAPIEVPSHDAMTMWKVANKALDACEPDIGTTGEEKTNAG